jgi:sugar phosphate isomerase/epimerase
MLGISTCWWLNRVDRGDEIVRGVLELGLQGIELEYRITKAIYQQMKPLLKDALQVLTIHNYFPLPEGEAKGSGDLFLLSSTDPDERSRAIKYSIRTIEHAHDLGAKVVILHLGRVDMPNPTVKIKELLRKGKREESELLTVIEEQRQARKASHQKHLDAVLSSLDTLSKEAEKRDVLLGIENRYHLHEIPDFEGIEIILEHFRGGNLRYWHDVGHAGTQENMGFVRQADLLEAYSDNMAGIHLHDFTGLDDHFAPGYGEMNFEELKSHLKPSHIKILEVHAKVDRDDLIKGIQYIQSLGIT